MRQYQGTCIGGWEQCCAPPLPPSASSASSPQSRMRRLRRSRPRASPPSGQPSSAAPADRLRSLLSRKAQNVRLPPVSQTLLHLCMTDMAHGRQRGQLVVRVRMRYACLPNGP